MKNGAFFLEFVAISCYLLSYGAVYVRGWLCFAEHDVDDRVHVTGGRFYCHATRWRGTRCTTCLQISSLFLIYARVLEHYRDNRTVPLSHYLESL